MLSKSSYIIYNKYEHGKTASSRVNCKIGPHDLIFTGCWLVVYEFIFSIMSHNFLNDAILVLLSYIDNLLFKDDNKFVVFLIEINMLGSHYATQAMPSH